MPQPRHASLFLCAAVLWLALAAGVQGQWLVYELKFQADEDGVNFSHYTGGYLVAPVQGGVASLVFTTEEGGRFFTVAAASAKFFVAASPAVRKAAFSAIALTGTAQAMYSASGHMNRTLLLDGPEGTRSWRVAEELQGRLLAADDESTLGPAEDGSLGMVGSAVITATLREDLTANATAGFTTLAESTRYIADLLERYDYSPDEGVLPVEAMETAPVMDAEGQMIDASLFPAEALGSGNGKEP